jgi:hypothetical protein
MNKQRKYLLTLLLSLGQIALIYQVGPYAAQMPGFKKDTWKERADINKNVAYKLAGLEMPENWGPPITDGLGSGIGFDPRAIISNSPGLRVGYTTYDLQSNSRMNRQVEWRATQAIQFIWMSSMDSTASVRWTRYEAWEPSEGQFLYESPTGGINLHPDGARSGYVSLDVDTEGKAVVANHYSPTGLASEMVTTVQYDFLPLSANFSPYKRILPDSISKYGVSEENINSNNWRFCWPQHEYQVYGGDTVTHVFARQRFSSSVDETDAYIHYFRRVGSDTLGSWDYPPPIVDTVPTVSQCVSASRVSPKVALVWAAGPGAYPGDPESFCRYDRIDPGLGHAQRTNDVFYMTSSNMGLSWGSKHNITAYDSTRGGWLTEGDIAILIDSSDYLHILYVARRAVPKAGALGEWTNYFGSRLWHWDEYWQEHRVVKDGTWELEDTSCTGGAWNQVNIVKPMISFCDGRFYAVFVQFNDGWNGIQNDCAEARFSGNAGWSGTANGELYISVSDNGGRHWDVARNLTNTYTPHCYSSESEGFPVCESDHFPSIPRFGYFGSDGFEEAVVVDPSDGSYTGNHFLDVFYVNDKFPGSCMQDAGVWTTNPVKWFRVPCVEPVPDPVLVWHPYSIGQPTWTKVHDEIDTPIVLENVGNATLVIDSIVPLFGTGPVGWLGVDTVGPLDISHFSPTLDTIMAYLNYNGVISEGPVVIEGWIEITSNSLGGSVDSIAIELIVADTVQFPDSSEIRTECIRLTFNNTGNMGRGGGPVGNGGWNLNFFNDCDVTDNRAGQDNHAGIYLYEASPFLTWIEAGDTILNYGMFDADWLDEEGFRPQASSYADSTTYSDYQYGNSREFLSHDSTIALVSEYFAPKHPDSCTFIISKQTIYLNTAIDTAARNNIYIGEFLDWDIPSDSNSENDSDYDPMEQMFYFIGAEYEPDDTTNDNCVFSNRRYGSFAYDKGYRRPFTGVQDSFPIVKAMWSHMNADWVYPTGGFPAGPMYRKIDATYGYERWTSTNPTMEDSQYQDLHQVTVFGQYDITKIDTLVFIKIFMTEYDGGEAGLYATLAKARAWIAAKPDLFGYPYRVDGRCCFGDSSHPYCQDLQKTECEAKPDFIAWDYGLNCTDDPCPPFGPIGRCCYDNPLFGYCEDITEIECTQKTPPYSWDSNMNCAEHPCEDRVGRCCYGDPADPQCADVTYWDCLVLGKISWDYGLNCAEHSCLDLVAYWKFDETGGPVAYDSSGYGNDGTLQNSPARISGLMGRALEFDGIDDYVYVPDNSSLRPSTLTLMAWIRPYRLPYTSTYGPIIKRTPEWQNDANWQMQIVASGRVNFAYYNNGWRDSPLTNDSVKVDKWNHIAITFRDREVRIYINGILDAAFPYIMDADLPTGYSSPVIIGKGWADKFEGRIDEVKIYAQALSDSLILKKYIEAGCGDVNDDNAVNMLDILYLISYLYKGGPAPVPLESGDANGDGKTDMLDILYLISYLYKNGKPPICS